MYLKSGKYYCFHPEILQSDREDTSASIITLEGMFITYSKNKKYAIFAKKSKFQLSFEIYYISRENVISEDCIQNSETAASDTINHMQLDTFIKGLEYDRINEPKCFSFSQIEVSNYFVKKNHRVFDLYF
jgi:hypothetical protein